MLKAMQVAVDNLKQPDDDFIMDESSALNDISGDELQKSNYRSELGTNYVVRVIVFCILKRGRRAQEVVSGQTIHDENGVGELGVICIIQQFDCH